MIAALLLDGFGELRRAGLERGHDNDPESAEWTGCGVPALYDGGRSRWDPDALLAEAEEMGYSSDDIASEDGTGLAFERYPYAAFGGVWKQLGWLWDRCPHWYVEHATPRARSISLQAIQLRRLASIGAPLPELTAAGSRLLIMCDQYWKHLQSVQDQRRMREARERAQRKG